MTLLIQRMREELIRRNDATTTIHSYTKAVEHFDRHVDIPLEQIGPDDIRSYHAYLLQERSLRSLLFSTFARCASCTARCASGEIGKRTCRILSSECIRRSSLVPRT